MEEEWDRRERRRRADRRARFEEIRADLATRLRATCATMTAEEFEALVARMARLQLRYESESATWGTDP